MQTLSSAPDPAVSIAVTILALLLALTGFGLWTAFGPKAAKLTDPWDDHDAVSYTHLRAHETRP